MPIYFQWNFRDSTSTTWSRDDDWPLLTLGAEDTPVDNDPDPGSSVLLGGLFGNSIVDDGLTGYAQLDVGGLEIGAAFGAGDITGYVEFGAAVEAVIDNELGGYAELQVGYGLTVSAIIDNTVVGYVEFGMDAKGNADSMLGYAQLQVGPNLTVNAYVDNSLIGYAFLYSDIVLSTGDGAIVDSEYGGTGELLVGPNLTIGRVADSISGYADLIFGYDLSISSTIDNEIIGYADLGIPPLGMTGEGIFGDDFAGYVILNFTNRGTVWPFILGHQR